MTAAGGVPVLNLHAADADAEASRYAAEVEDWHAARTSQEALTTAVEALLGEHRRSQNTRGCTGCLWRPRHAGRTDDAAATRGRNVQFNRHLAVLISDALTR